MQRVRVGLTGLACVFLLVMLAAVFLRAAGGEQVTPTQNETAALSNGMAAATPNEPLAQLGVAPGNVPTDTATAPPPGVSKARPHH